MRHSATYINSSDAGDGIFRLWGSIPCLVMPLNSPMHQQAWYWLIRTDNMSWCYRINFIYLGQAKSTRRLKMWTYLTYLLSSLKHFNMLRVNIHKNGKYRIAGDQISTSSRIIVVLDNDVIVNIIVLYCEFWHEAYCWNPCAWMTLHCTFSAKHCAYSTYNLCKRDRVGTPYRIWIWYFLMSIICFLSYIKKLFR